jgi:peroxiredoxin
MAVDFFRAWRRAGIAGLLVLTLVASACAPNTGDGAFETAVAEELEASTNNEPSIPAAQSETGALSYRGGGEPTTSLEVALAVSMDTVGGPPIDVSQYLGNDVVLWFWAPWCSWCNAEAPRVSAMATQFEGSVEIVGIGGVSSIDQMARFVERHDLHHITHLADHDGMFWREFDVTYQPWWMFVNDDGTVIRNWQGRLDADEIEALMQELVDT